MNTQFQKMIKENKANIKPHKLILVNRLFTGIGCFCYIWWDDEHHIIQSLLDGQQDWSVSWIRGAYYCCHYKLSIYVGPDFIWCRFLVQGTSCWGKNGNVVKKSTLIERNIDYFDNKLVQFSIATWPYSSLKSSLLLSTSIN